MVRLERRSISTSLPLFYVSGHCRVRGGMINDTSHGSKGEYGVWGLIGGAIIAMIIGFAWGGWTTTRTTKRLGDEAILAAQAAICVAELMKQRNHQEELQELEKVNSYPRSTFIEKGGWDKMPGEKGGLCCRPRMCRRA